MPTLDPIPRDPSQAFAVAAMLWSFLQLILARWRDLAPVTLALAGAALTVGTTPPVAGACLLAVLVSGLAQARGARLGVGRPEIVGLTLSGVAFGGLLPLWLPALVPTVDLVRVRAVALMPILLSGALGGVLALERAGTRPVPPRWIGRIPIDPGAPGDRPGHAKGTPDPGADPHV